MSDRLTPAEIRLAQYGEHAKSWSTATYNDGTEKALHEIALGLKTELDRVRAESDQLYNDLTGANLARWEEENDARRARAAAANARKRAATLRTERDEAHEQLAKAVGHAAQRAEYITAINGCHDDADYWRWQGHAESRRQLSEVLNLPVAWPATDEEASR